MPTVKIMKGISRVDRPEKSEHGYIVHLARAGQKHWTYFGDKAHGGPEPALAAAQKHLEQLLEKYGPPHRPMHNLELEHAVGGKPQAPAHAPKNVTPDQLVWVQCPAFHCLAYQNAQGHWMNFYTGKRLKGAVKVIN